MREGESGERKGRAGGRPWDEEDEKREKEKEGERGYAKAMPAARGNERVASSPTWGWTAVLTFIPNPFSSSNPSISVLKNISLSAG
jgi:hypothetical protein